MKAQDIIKISRSTWMKAGQMAKGLIQQDADKGKFQNEKKNISYKSKQYTDYKSAGMVGKRGKKLKGFKGASINRNTKFKDMKLTGETLRRISVKPLKDSFELNYERGEIVLGNDDADIYDLRNANREKVMDTIMADISRKANKYMAEDVNIKIG